MKRNKIPSSVLTIKDFLHLYMNSINLQTFWNSELRNLYIWKVLNMKYFSVITLECSFIRLRIPQWLSSGSLSMSQACIWDEGYVPKPDRTKPRIFWKTLVICRKNILSWPEMHKLNSNSSVAVEVILFFYMSNKLENHREKSLGKYCGAWWIVRNS